MLHDGDAGGAPDWGDPLPPYVDPFALLAEVVPSFGPPRRMSVSEAAEAYRVVKNPGGGYSGPWRNDQVPYLVEPMDMMTSRGHKGLILVAPAQTGKTDGLLINGVVHTVTCDPADELIIQTSRDMAQDFSIRRLDRLNDDSPEVGRRLSSGKSADNVFTKRYGPAILSLGWPTKGHLAGRPVPRVRFTDYDRLPDDIEGEGGGFDLGAKRIETFGSRGMVVAESSPSKPITDPKWKRKAEAPHEAPPCGGILELFNRGDRRLWYWPCPHCGERFEGRFKHLKWDEGLEPADAAATVVMVCPNNGCVIEPQHKPAMNAAGRWVAEGQTISANGEVTGRPRRSSIASYWLKGPAAAFQSWAGLVEKYLNALAAFERTGSEDGLKATVNTDQGEAYLDKAAEGSSSIDAEKLLERVEVYPLQVVPRQVRFLVASVDVQANRFAVLVRGFGPDLESWVVDRFDIWKPEDDDRPLDPATQPKDWDLIEARVMDRLYPMALKGAAGEALQMMPALTVIDSAGAPGVTDQAYKFWRRMRKVRKVARLRLLKGTGHRAAKRVQETFPTSKRQDRKAGGRGEVPVHVFNANTLKDSLQGHLKTKAPGPGFVHLAEGLKAEREPHPFFEELTAEERKADGTWHKTKRRNEAIDLMVMAHTGAIIMGADKIDWSDPAKPWALAGLDNSLVEPATIEAAEVEGATEDEAGEDAGASQAQRPARGRRGGFVKGW